MTRKLIIIAILIMIFTASYAQENPPPMLNMLFSGGAFFPKYSSYHFQSPVYCLTLDADFLNLYMNYGLGGGMFYTIDSYDKYFDKITYYEAYIHNIAKTEDRKSSFSYGFFLGFRRTDLEFIEKKSELKINSFFVRPLIGLKYSGNGWGSKIAWTMNEREKSRFEYDVKFMNNKGWWLTLGGSSRGFVKDNNSDLHIYLGYQFDLGY